MNEGTCESCGVKIYAPPCRVKVGRAKYCSRQCYVNERTHKNRIKPRDFGNVKTLSSIEASWLAAIIDGEGHIVISPRGYTRIAVANTCKALLEHCYDVSGVGYISDRKVYKEHHKPAWTWVCNGWSAVSVLKQVLPFLIAKVDRAQNAIDLPAYQENK